jgi:hypothetical protein
VGEVSGDKAGAFDDGAPRFVYASESQVGFHMGNSQENFGYDFLRKIILRHDFDLQVFPGQKERLVLGSERDRDNEYVINSIG